MFRPIPIPAVMLSYPLPFGGSQLRVPTGVYNEIQTKLGASNWTYFRITQGRKAEIVKVVGLVAPDTVVVRRAYDSTDEESFAAGAVLDYVDTVAGLLDNYTFTPVVLHALDAIQIVGDIVSYKTITIKGLGATEVVGDSAGLVIGRKENTYGCCTGNNDPLPLPA